MNALELIGKVAALYLQDKLSEDPGAISDGTAPYIIDRLSAEQTAAIAREILQDPALVEQIDLKLPAHFMVGQGLPPEVLTPFSATYHRDAPCAKPVLLLANTGDDEEQSLMECSRIGAPELQEQGPLWVRVASQGLSLSQAHAKWWEKALAGLQELRNVSLEFLAGYVIRTREAVLTDGFPILAALGVALPALRFPRDKVFSNRIRETARGHMSAWKTQFNWMWRNRACYLLKQTPSQLILGEDDLETAFEKTKDSIPAVHHPAVLAFIQAPSGWNEAARRLSECEWEEIKPLFDGVKREKFNLGRETISFYEDRDQDLLTDEEREYLKLLADCPTTDAKAEDQAFYESHRNELKEDRKLKSAWDRFIFGKPRETEDFLAGLVAAMESLFNQGEAGSGRVLKIRCDRATKKDLKEVNVDAGRYFAQRYAGLRAVLGEHVSWNVGQLFEFPALVESWIAAGKTAASGKTSLNRSTARAALQLKFVLELEVELAIGGSKAYSTQLVWKFNPNTVVSQFYDDWARLEEHPLVFCRAAREAISAKGRFQTVDLSNVRTFLPAYDRDRGSFVAAFKKSQDVASEWQANLQSAITQGLLTEAIAKELEFKLGSRPHALMDRS